MTPHGRVPDGGIHKPECVGPQKPVDFSRVDFGVKVREPFRSVLPNCCVHDFCTRCSRRIRLLTNRVHVHVYGVHDFARRIVYMYMYTMWTYTIFGTVNVNVNTLNVNQNRELEPKS